MKSAVLLVAVVASVSACGKRVNSTPEPRPQAGESTGADYVLRGSDFNGSLLETLRHRVQNASVTYPSNGGCPRISLRGTRASGNPSVYIDGTLVDSCALTNLTAQDIDRAEIYRSGAATKAGIRNNPNGLLLIYRVRT